MGDKIFISVAAYRDPELLSTIRDCLKRAEHPEDLVFAIAWQHSVDDEWDTLEEFVDDPRFHIIDIVAEESKGACWARNLAQKEYRNETYYMQLDSHHRFARKWDTSCKDMLKQLQDKGHKKPILTSYIPSYNPQNDPGERVKVPWKLNFDRFTPEGVIFMLPSAIEEWEERKEPLHSRFFSAHFVFTIGQWAKEVIYDPNLYFHGEEITLAVRSFTHGYDLFTPHKVVAWHEYTRVGRVKHWDNFKEWYKINKQSLLRCKKLLGVDNVENDIDFGEYGFGKERTKEDYEKFAGIRFTDRGVQQYTLDNFEPPNTQYNSEEMYDTSFKHVFRHCIDLHKHSIPDIDYDGWAVTLETDDGDVILRQDVLKDEIERMKTERNEKQSDWYNIWRTAYTDIIPDKAIIWPYSSDPEIGWGPRTEIRINKS